MAGGVELRKHPPEVGAGETPVEGVSFARKELPEINESPGRLVATQEVRRREHLPLEY